MSRLTKVYDARVIRKLGCADLEYELLAGKDACVNTGLTRCEYCALGRAGYYGRKKYMLTDIKEVLGE